MATASPIAITVPTGLSYTVSLTGNTLYTTSALSSAATFPQTISAGTTTYWANGIKTYTYSCKFNGVELRGTSLSTNGQPFGISDAPSPTAIQIAAGEVAATVSALNVMDYGATGNGTTDDTTAIQSAITAGAATGASTVFFPPGTYICQPITIPAGVVLQGVNCQGSGGAGTKYTQSVIRLKAGSTGALISPNDSGTTSSYVKILDLGLFGNGINQPLINMPDSGGVLNRKWIIQGCYIYPEQTTTTVSGDAVYIGSNNVGCVMRDCEVSNTDAVAYSAQGGFNGVHWYGSDGLMDHVWIGSFGSSGLLIDGGASNETFVWRNGGTFWNTFGISVGGGNAVIDGVSIDHNLQDGIFISSTPTAIVNCTFQTNSVTTNNNWSHIYNFSANNEIFVSGCHVMQQDGGIANKAKYFFDDESTGTVYSQVGCSAVSGVLATGWTNYPVLGTTYNTALANDTALTIDSATHTLITSPSLPVGTYLVTATVTLQDAGTGTPFPDFALAKGTAVGTLVGTPGMSFGFNTAADQFQMLTATVTCVMTVTTAGTMILQYNAATAASGAVNAKKNGSGTNLGSASGITAVKIADSNF